MSLHYWAVMYRGREDTIRIEKAQTAIVAIRIAYGTKEYPDLSPMAKYEIDRYRVKDLGTRVGVIQSDRKRIALLKDPNGWVDPFAYRKESDRAKR